MKDTGMDEGWKRKSQWLREVEKDSDEKKRRWKRKQRAEIDVKTEQIKKQIVAAVERQIAAATVL